MNRKIIKLTITLAGKDESFTSEDKQNTMSATGLRVSVDIAYGFGAVMPSAQIRIYGLAMNKMNKLLRVRWNTLEAIMNRVKIEVGDEGKPLATVFEGNITFAYPDFANAPNVSLVIESQTAVAEHLKPATPSSYAEPTDIAQIFKDITDDMGWQLENNGVSKIIDTWTKNEPNTAKLKELAAAYDVDLYIENGLVAITTKGGSRNIKIPVISPETGLIGYPVPDLKGVSFKCFYDPLVRFGGVLKIQDSLIEVCNGEWRVYGIRTSLEANQPNGNWFHEVNATWRDSSDAAIAKK